MGTVRYLVEQDEYEADGEDVDGEEGDDAVAGGRSAVGAGLARPATAAGPISTATIPPATSAVGI